MPNSIPVSIRSASENAKGLEEGECSTRVEAEVAAAEAARFAVFDCRNLSHRMAAACWWRRRGRWWQ